MWETKTSSFSSLICKTCVLKMDHYCPWICNCVGWKNYKFFLLFLCYTILLGLSIAFSLIGWIINSGISLKGSVGDLQILLTFLVSTVFGLGICLFSGMHFKLVFRNTTTIEMHSKENNPYDIGSRRNFEQVFGSSPLLWFIPISTSIGDGIKWSTKLNNFEDNSLLNT